MSGSVARCGEDDRARAHHNRASIPMRAASNVAASHREPGSFVAMRSEPNGGVFPVGLVRRLLKEHKFLRSREQQRKQGQTATK